MKSIQRIFGVMAVLAGTALFAVPAPQAAAATGLFGHRAKSSVPELTDANEKTLIGNAKTLVVIDFYATWCGPCRRFSPTVDAIAKAYKGKVIVVKCDIDQNPGLVATHKVSVVPTIAFIKPNGTKSYQTGGRSFQEMKDLIDEALKP